MQVAVRRDRITPCATHILRALHSWHFKCSRSSCPEKQKSYPRNKKRLNGSSTTIAVADKGRDEGVDTTRNGKA